MSNRLAVILALMIAAAILADQVLAGGDNLLFLARKFADLTEYMAFWR